MENCGELSGREILKIVPIPCPPPVPAVPYKLLPENRSKPLGWAPSPFALNPRGVVVMSVKLCRRVNPEPSSFIWKTVPQPASPPTIAVPYKVLPFATKPDVGCAPSWFSRRPAALVLVAEKVCSVWKCDPLVDIRKIVPLPYAPPLCVVPKRLSPDNTSPPVGFSPS